MHDDIYSVLVPYPAKAIYSHIDYRLRFISQQNQLLSAQIYLFFTSLVLLCWLLLLALSSYCFSVSIPFELLASHPSLGSCNIFILSLPPKLKKGISQ